MDRRAFMLTGAGAASSQTGPKPRQHPNVILIMTDDQGYGDLSLHGNGHLQTPQLDRLASQGVEFTRFTVSSVCAPTRASLLTGRYALRGGVHGVTGGKETMRHNEVTIARVLQVAGYRTGLIGKWHLGENYPYVPHASGFDEFVGFRLGHWNRYFDAPVERNGKPERLKGYVTDALTSEAIGFIDRHRAGPFFLYLALNAPHSPYQAPDRYFDRHNKMLGDPELAAIHAMVENIDDNVGRLLARLDELKLRDDTIVIFLCDNGPQTQRYVAGLRGRKGMIYEGGTRAPFFLRWPGHAEAGRKVDRVAAHIDVFPTLLDLCGVKAPAAAPSIDGVSLAPLLRSGTERSWPSRLIFSHSDHQPDPRQPFPGSVRDQRWKMVNGTELYDLAADPTETNNVAAAHPSELQRLNHAYREWFTSVTAGFSPGAPPIPVGYWEENPAVLSAPQAQLSGGAAFYARHGFANDFVKGWGEPAARAAWKIEVVAGGRYEVWVELLAAAAGQPVSFTVGAESLEAHTAQADVLTPNVLPERSPHRSAAPDMTWTRLRLGRLPLEPGFHQVALQGRMTYVKSIELRRIR